MPAPGATAEDVKAGVQTANRRLPDYARIGDWIVAARPFTPGTGELTANGRIRRDAIWSRYRAELDAVFDELLDLTA